MNFTLKALAVASFTLPSFVFAQDAGILADPAAPASAPAAPAAAPAPISANVATEMNKAVTTHVAQKAQSIIKDDMAEYCKEVGITIGAVTPKGSIYLEGFKTVEVKPDHPDFIRMRALNFDEAYAEAVTKYVMDKLGETSAEEFSQTFKPDDKFPAVEDGTPIEKRIEDKMQLLKEAQLDDGLRKLGVEPAGTLEQKRVKARELFIKKSIKKAVGSSAGLLPVQTFEGWDESKTYALGCIVRGGVETETIAECLRDKRRPVLSRPEAGLTVREALPSDEELVSQFGVRMFFDKDGVPALLSFGQWGSAYSGNDEALADKAMEEAMEMAQAQADDQLTMFVNSAIDLYDEKSRGKFEETRLEGTMEKTVRGLVQASMKQAVKKGSDTMIGRSTVCEKVIRHPAGHRIAMCVRMWSFGQYDAMKRIIERPQDPVEVAPVEAPAAPAAGTSGRRRGRSYDF